MSSSRRIPPLSKQIERLSGYLGNPQCDELDPIDTIPNLLLLERLIDELPGNAATALRAELAPAFDAIDPRLRGALRMLIETGLAPSPFCAVDEDDPHWVGT